MKIAGRILAILILIGLMVHCKKDEEPDTTACESGKPAFKRTEFTLESPEGFPPFLKETILTEEIVSLGRDLFYEKKLSGDGTQSCGSCHNQEFAFTDNGKQFSEGIDGKEGDMNAMALFNLNWGNGFFWDGRSPTLKDQALEPVINPIEMHNTWANAINTLKGDTHYVNEFYRAFGTDDWDSTHAAEALAQFEKTLLSANSPFDKLVQQFGTKPPYPWPNQSVARGFDIFTREPKQSPNGPGGGDCFHCHPVDNMLFTDNTFKNNGLDLNPDQGLAKVTGNANDVGKFKTPSLRNLTKSGPYMHDGRFKTLLDVVNFYDSQVEPKSPNLDPLMNDTTGGRGIVDGLFLKDDEKRDLIAFLEFLNDEEFLTNKDFSDPNK